MWRVTNKPKVAKHEELTYEQLLQKETEAIVCEASDNFVLSSMLEVCHALSIS